ncbi:MAG TPA: type III-B CRISPR module RAMP protein Cmr6, partial [Mycobacteriales bacterium]|nr:type III-B CRISPR module RAMP protein Cmr6 [Mycobacteriales bacterium]
RDVFGDEPPGSGETGAATGVEADSGTGSGEAKAKAGGVMFLDALPETASTRSNPVVSDLVNPHASPYYRTRGGVAPAEYHQPVPVAFLAVSSAVSFRIHLVSGPHATDLEPELAAGWLRTALDDLGVGGKTSAGYGYLDVEVLPDPESPPAAGQAGAR